MSSGSAAQSERRSGALLNHLARRMRLRSESVLAPLGLRSRHLVALTVLRDSGGISQQGLAGTLQIDGTNVVGLLNDLETAGLVERRRSPEDRRRHVVSLTEAGAKRLNEAECALVTAEDDVLGALDPAERDTLYELLRRASSGAQLTCADAVRNEPDARY
ncbi:DNA-binding transcriptional regulator, MarR family [Micromonospora phaseoli]|uniref:DNA-binding transcriptional regulator, MarR family n=1 Tax=Micromonospora phaseoli TaxID=1144548 RepID=A0A1H6ZGW0_9ACTN|nr:MarR family winged helix-turn-helix transcriptional regulator [Micromonospora phaseoli]PZV97243.1 DNA-binding MarR family transcriptional regulator [Micromonospora phaseoli]GIJ77178.1 MarR family transcriptional regulator [Micromonospora phaseoli]SEJ51936.1 DNA-binding transcriptional regulator, MarR family [Micromonospora phaseoli]